MQRRSVPACCLVVLLVVSTVAMTVPAAASATAPPSSVSAATEATDTSVQTDSYFNGTAFLAVDETSDGDVVAGGITGTLGAASGQSETNTPNATLVRVGDDGTTEWSTRFDGQNATQVVDVLAADDGIYFTLVERSPGATGFESVDVRLGKASDDGDVLWQQSLDASYGFGTTGTLVDTDDGVALAHRTDDRAVRFAEYSGRTVVWNRTYDVDARVNSVRVTDDGFLLTGSVSFDEPWVLRTSASGRPALNETYPGIESGGVLGAVPTDDDGVLLAARHRPSFGGAPSAMTARIDSDGQVRWTRVHGAGSEVQVNQVFDTDDGVLLVGQDLAALQGDGAVRFLGVDADGAEVLDERVEGVPRITAMTRGDDALRVAGLHSLDVRNGTYTGTLTDISVPDGDVGADAALDPDVALTSNDTLYRGQDVRISSAGRADAYDLVRLPGERDEFDPHVVRRVSTGVDGDAVFESATLPRGEYVLRTTDGQPVAVEDGQVQGATDREEAAFRLDSQRFFRVETNRTFVDTAAGEHGVSLTFDSERSNYDVHVRADQFRGGTASADDLRAAFGDVDGFEGVDSVDGQAAARIHVGESDGREVRLNASVESLDAGLYDVEVSAVDTRDGGAVADGRVVVGATDERPVGLELENRSLSVPAGDETVTNVTMTNLTDGIGALSLAANRTGEPDVRIRLRADVNGSRVTAGSSISPRESETEMTAIGANTDTGTVEVGQLRIRGESLGRDPLTNGTNTATFRVDWIVDEDGVPYTVPDPVTVTYEVTDAGNATGDTERGGARSGSGSASGSTSGSAGSN
jgi:hypothetical protein